GVTTNGDLLSLLGNISIGSSQVKGDLFLGPGSSGSSKVSGKTSHDLNADFNDAVLPDGSWLPPVGGNRTINGTTYQYVFGSSGDYSIATPGAIYVGPSAQVRLKIVSDNFAATAIKVAGTGSQKGKLTIYDNGTSFTLNGNADSDSNDPAALTYFGLPQNKGIVFNKNSYFTGTIYAPSANFTNNVLLRTQATFSGALTVNSIFINGLASFAFDEHLLKSQNLSRGYLVTSWREL
ncbi:MAG TPA: hypothetical protein VLT36_07760, partial [Candidatus Dormibacteraeota bacterium]|nr:hypothetical protein [Candidatus Dormibacteraeota bacterium]